MKIGRIIISAIVGYSIYAYLTRDNCKRKEIPIYPVYETEEEGWVMDED